MYLLTTSGVIRSLTVTSDIVEAARKGRLDDEAFITCVRDSLPYAYNLVAELAAALPSERAAGRDVADNMIPHRATRRRASCYARWPARRSGRHSNGTSVSPSRSRFQNCHRVGVFPPQAVGGDQYNTFVSTRAQISSQRPELVNC